MLIQNYRTYHIDQNSFIQLAHKRYGPENADNLILCMHGLGLNGDMFHEFATCLPHNYKAITIDFSGHGRSDKAHSYTLEEYCKQAIAVMNLTSFKTLICFGNGIGNMVAFKLAGAGNSPISAIISDLSENDLLFLKKSIRKSDFESLLGVKKNGDYEKYFRYMIRNFKIDEDYLYPICDEERLSYSDIKSLENIDKIKAGLASAQCDCFILQPQGINNATENISQKHRIEYSRYEIERILEWMQNQIPNEKTRLINLLEVDTGKRQDVI